MSGRAVILTSSAVVFAAFLALLGLALFRSGGEPGSLGVNKDFGEVSIEEKPAPDFTLELLQGGSVSLGDLRGRVVLVDFWASWCPPCIEEAPILNSVYDEYSERGVEFLGVCIWDTTKGCEQFLQEFDVAYPSGRDSEGAILVDYGVKGIPEKFFIDAQGRVARKFAGPYGTRTSCATFWTRCWPTPAEKPGYVQKGRPPKSELRILNSPRRLAGIHPSNRFPNRYR